MVNSGVSNTEADIVQKDIHLLSGQDKHIRMRYRDVRHALPGIFPF
jgi:hypothetical protein